MCLESPAVVCARFKKPPAGQGVLYAMLCFLCGSLGVLPQAEARGILVRDLRGWRNLRG